MPEIDIPGHSVAFLHSIGEVNIQNIKMFKFLENCAEKETWIYY